jgi:Fimbrial assembly protein (PilN)
MIPAGIRKWLAYGTGLGLEIAGPRGAEVLNASVVRVRPGGAKVLGSFQVEDFQNQPADVWGTEIAAFARGFGAGNLVASVVLPRQDVIVRTLALPGVTDKDLGAAVGFQLDSLHPYDEADVSASWSRLAGTSTVLVAIARREVIERYATLFAEAGIKVGSFTCSAAAVYSALRLFGDDPPSPLLAASESPLGVEVYGESPSRPVYSSATQLTLDRALAVAMAELRLEEPPAPKSFSDLMGAEQPLPVAGALASACPRHVLSLNLLPETQRQATSPFVWVPSAVLGLIILMLGGTLLALPGIEEHRYGTSLAAEVAGVEPGANRSAVLDKEIESTRRRAEMLDELRRRPKADLDALQEMTRVIPPPTWLNSLELNAKQLMVVGETDQAAPLLKTIDTSPAFEGSEFVGSPIRMQAVERFQIRTNREVKK